MKEKLAFTESKDEKKKSKSCFEGKILISWMVSTYSSVTEEKALSVAQNMLKEGYILPEEHDKTNFDIDLR